MLLLSVDSDGPSAYHPAHLLITQPESIPPFAGRGDFTWKHMSLRPRPSSARSLWGSPGLLGAEVWQVGRGSQGAVHRGKEGDEGRHPDAHNPSDFL